MLKRESWHHFNDLVISQKKIISFVNAGPSIEVIGRYFKIFEKNIKNTMHKNGPEIFNYAETKGSELLRKRLVEKGLAGEASNKEMVLITNGGQEALKIIVETMLKKGERIMVEKLSYVGLEQIVLNNNGKIVCFSDNINNLKLTKIEEELRKNRPKLLYLIPDFSNPGGEVIQNRIRKLLARLAKELSFWIIEDQTYRELYFDNYQQLKSIFSMCERVMIVGSSSKTIVPGLRIGWLVVRDELLSQKLIQIKESFSLSTNNLSQRLLADLLEEEYSKTVGWVRNYYGKKMKKVLNCLKTMMPMGFTWVEPEGGFYVWINGPKKFNAEKTLGLALKNGVAFIPGSVFYYGKKEKNTFRLSISGVKEDEIEEGIRRLAMTLF